jgi:hypothetical protein
MRTQSNDSQRTSEIISKLEGKNFKLNNIINCLSQISMYKIDFTYI